MAGTAWLGDHLAGAAADGTGTRNREEALLETHLAAAAALLAGAGGFAVRGARSAALRADVHALDGDGRLLAEDRLLEIDGQVIADIAAALRTRDTSRTTARDVEHLSEKVAEDIAQVHAARKAAFCGASTVYAGDAITVVGRALLRIAQDLVGLARLLEALLRIRIVRIAVGVITHCQLAVCGLKLLLPALSRNAQDFVVIDVCHVCHFSCTQSSVQLPGKRCSSSGLEGCRCARRTGLAPRAYASDKFGLAEMRTRAGRNSRSLMR